MSFRSGSSAKARIRKEARRFRAANRHIDERDIGVRPGVVKILGVEHEPAKCDIFGCELCIAAAGEPR